MFTSTPFRLNTTLLQAPDWHQRDSFAVEGLVTQLEDANRLKVAGALWGSQQLPKRVYFNPHVIDAVLSLKAMLEPIREAEKLLRAADGLASQVGPRCCSATPIAQAAHGAGDDVA